MAVATARASQDLALRAPGATHASSIARLLDQFGYPADAANVGSRLARMVANLATYVLVAIADGTVIGIGAVHFIDILEGDQPLAALVLLIVDERHREQGVGRAIVEGLEREAEARGSFGISVHSGKQRVGAHAFYQRLGYELTGERMLKLFPAVSA